MKTKAELYESAAISDLMESIDPREQRKVEKRMQLAAKIMDGMKAKGWKKKDLMKAMGQNNQSVVTKWLSGTHNFNMETLMDLEEVLDIKLIDVVTKKDVITSMHVRIVQAPSGQFGTAYMTDLIKNSVGLATVNEQRSYYGKPVEA